MSKTDEERLIELGVIADRKTSRRDTVRRVVKIIRDINKVVPDRFYAEVEGINFYPYEDKSGEYARIGVDFVDGSTGDCQLHVYSQAEFFFVNGLNISEDFTKFINNQEVK